MRGLILVVLVLVGLFVGVLLINEYKSEEITIVETYRLHRIMLHDPDLTGEYYVGINSRGLIYFFMNTDKGIKYVEMPKTLVYFVHIFEDGVPEVVEIVEGVVKKFVVYVPESGVLLYHK